MNDVPQYPWRNGDALYASALNAAIANGPYVPTHGAVNVLNFNADPTGTVDSSQAFCNALASRHDGRPVDVFVPSGVYRLDCSITVGDPVYSQRLFGNGWASVLLVGPSFDPTANGVIILASGNNIEAQPSVCDLYIQFQQPPDISTTTTASTAAGGTDVTLASTAGIRIGYYCRDMTNPNSLPFQSTMPQVTDIDIDGVVTLSQPASGTVGVGDVMQFAANRSQTVTLASAPTLNPGAPAIQYPWAIYAAWPTQSVFLDHILIGGAWNGIYIRGQSVSIGQYFVGCLNIGLDIDQCYNFSNLDHFMLWGWGIADASGVPDACAAILGIYYDGQTIAANFGEVDDLDANIIQSWCGKVNLTPAWSWGKINQLSLDGDNSALSVAGGTFLEIGAMYKTGGQNNLGTPLSFTSPCRTSIGSIWMAAAHATPAIVVSNGVLMIEKGYLWNGLQGNTPMISLTGGTLDISQTQFDSSPERVAGYLTQTGGTVRISDSSFIITPAPGGVAFNLTDATLNAITNVELNGWSYSVPGPLGRYEQRSSIGVTFSNISSRFVEPDTPTTAQVALSPPPTGPAGAQGKLRFHASFPTGTDFVPRLSASLRAGFTAALWLGAYLDVWIANGTNDVGSDANMVHVAQFTANFLQLPILAASPSHPDDATAALGGVPIGGLYRNGSQVMVRVA